MKEIKIKTNTITANPEHIYETKVRKFGNGAAIPGRKKDIGREVIVIVKEKEQKIKELTKAEVKRLVALYDED